MELATYHRILNLLTSQGRTDHRAAPALAELPFLERIEGTTKLLGTLSAVAPAVPGTSSEEWNPLSQRPHAPLVPEVGDELGAEITILKEAVDAFTTLAHEMMHVALWEPFFVGHWQPRSRASFHAFALMSEGFCFFFSDVVISGAVHVRLPDGEFALARRSPSSAYFHPLRAFQALGLEDRDEILGIYLTGFNGGQTKLWQPKGTSNFAAALAKQAYEFYAGSLPLLDELHAALGAFGALTEFYERFCSIADLPSFLSKDQAQVAGSNDIATYFTEFYRSALPGLANLDAAQIDRIRWRRMLQMRAYYALQARWLLTEQLVVGRDITAATYRSLLSEVDVYLDSLAALLRQLARHAELSPVMALARLDATYDDRVRSQFLAHDAWVGQRWMIAPKRAGGRISAVETLSDRDLVIETVAFLVDELTLKLPECEATEARAELLAQIQRIAAVGASESPAGALRAHLSEPDLLPLWSAPMASFDPARNQYRELLFSYQ